MTGGKPRGYTRPRASERVLAQQRLMVAVAELVGQAMERRRVSSEQLADTLGVPTVEIRRRLGGRGELTLRALAAIFHALDYRLHLSLIPLVTETGASGGRERCDQVDTVAATLNGGPGDGQRVHVPICSRENQGPRPAPLVQVAIVDGEAHVLDTAPEEIRAKADAALLVYVRNFTADPTAPVYRYGGRRTPNQVRRDRASAYRRRDREPNHEE